MDSLEDWQRVTPDQVHNARQRLQETSDAIRSRLEGLPERLQPLSLAQKSDVLRDRLEEVLKLMGEGMFKAALAWFLAAPGAEETKLKRPLHLYFWPGYDSILLKGANRRVTLWLQRDPSTALACGIGRVGSADDNLTDNDDCATCEWFDRALTPSWRDVGFDNKHFVPGGTHPWAAVSKKVRGTPASRFLCLAVEVGDMNSPPPRQGFVRIVLPRSTPETWGYDIHRHLTNPNYFDPCIPWPLADPKEADPLGELQPIRNMLYSIWLAATFDSGWKEKCRKWFEEFVVRLEHPRPGQQVRLPNLAARLRGGFALREKGKPPDFQFWYTLHVEPTVAVAEPQAELGSAMLLSSERLGDPFILTVSSWVNNTYLTLRSLEGGIEREQFGRLEGEIEERNKQYEVQAHEIRKLVRLIDQSAPGYVLNVLRLYFNTIFASGSDAQLLHDPNGILPSEFGKGDTLAELVENCARIASRIETVLRWKEKGEIEPEPALEEAVERDILRVQQAIVLKIIRIPVGFSWRWEFCSALLCGLRNALSHGESNSPLHISFDGDDKSVVIRNRRKSVQDGSSGQLVPEKSHPGSTEQSIRFYAKRYGRPSDKDKLLEKDGADEWFWLTKVPCPYELVERWL